MRTNLSGLHAFLLALIPLITDAQEATPTPTPAPDPPVISVVSPAPGTALYELRPEIQISYSGTNVEPTSLVVLVNGADWSTKFSTGADSATHAITEQDTLVAGSLTIEASIRAQGVTGTTTSTYAVFPTLQAISPDLGEVETVVTLGAVGLDSDLSRSFALFSPGDIKAPLRSVDRAGGTAEAEVPPGAVTGPVKIEINGRVSREAFSFTVPPVMECQSAIDSFVPMADGGWVFVCGRTRWDAPNDASVWQQGPDGSRNRIFTCLDHGCDGPPSIGVDKTFTKTAFLFRRPYSNGYQDARVLYDGRLTTIVGIRWASSGDFDSDGNLYVMADTYGANPLARSGLWRISKEALAAGGPATPELILAFESVYQRYVQFNYSQRGLAVSCDGHAYMMFSDFLDVNGPTDPSVQPLYLKVDLQTKAVVGQYTGRPGEQPVNIAINCHKDELWGSTTVFEYENYGDRIVRSDIWRMRGVLGLEEVMETVAPGGYPNEIGIGATGSVYLATGDSRGGQGVLLSREAVEPCEDDDCGVTVRTMTACMSARATTSSPVALPLCVLQPPLAIQSSTTRWRAQRDTGSNARKIDIIFSGPSDLQTATVQVEGPSQVPEGQEALPSDYTPTLEAPFNPDAPVKDDAGNYKLVWVGPWTIRGPGDTNVALPRGNYKLTIAGTTRSSADEISSDPYDRVSLVEVTKVELLPEAQDPRADPLSSNPQVLSLTGQSPPQERRYLDGQGRIQAGKRIFAEAEVLGGTVWNRVTALATIDPPVPGVPVHFKLLDVDDPASATVDRDGDNGTEARDNRGTAEGITITPVVTINGKAQTTAGVSLQPGDNYRIVASTDSGWLGTVTGKQPSQTGEVSVGPEAKGSISEMLTVWRTLHMESDSMPEVPTAASDPERNFLEGTITAIYDVRSQGPGIRRPSKMQLSPEATAPVLGLADGSPDMSGVGNGRFEDGTVRIGVGAATIVADNLKGNGPDFIERWGGFVVPYTLMDSNGQNTVNGNIMEWDARAKTFTLGTAIGRPIYNGGRLSIGGVNWTVASVRGRVVTVVEDRTLPFHLVDDDRVIGVPTATPRATPTPAPTVGFGMLSTSDDPTVNPLAQAYIHPARDVTSPKPARFLRNASTPQITNPDGTSGEDISEPIGQLCKARDRASDEAYWLVYVQASFQGDEVRDRDPIQESGDDAGSRLGTTYSFLDSGRQFLASAGSLIYLETLRDASTPGTFQRCLDYTTAHELGHQFGLGHTQGIMHSPGCAEPGYFDAGDIALLRSVRAPGPVSRYMSRICPAAP